MGRVSESYPVAHPVVAFSVGNTHHFLLLGALGEEFGVRFIKSVENALEIKHQVRILQL